MRLMPKLTLLFVLLTVLSVVTVSVVAYRDGRLALERAHIGHLISTNLLKKVELDRWVEDSKRSIEELAQRPLVRQSTAVLASHNMSDPKYEEAHRNIVEEHLKPRLPHGGFLELFILCPRHGMVLASTDERQEGKYHAGELYFIEGKNRTYVQGVYYSDTLEEPAMAVGTPIKDGEGNLAGVLAGRLDLTGLSRIMEQWTGLSETEDSYLVNTSNLFVTEPRFGKGYALKKAVHTEGVEAALKGSNGVGSYDDYRGAPVIGAYRWLPEYEMCLITEVDQSEVYAPIYRLGWDIALVVLLLVAIVVLISFFATRSIIKPLHKLAEGVKKVGSGNLDYKVGAQARDEIGVLSRAFDQMTEDLKKTTVSREELRKSEEKFRIAASCVSDLVWDWDIINGRLEWFGDIDRMLGYDYGELPRTIEAWERVVHPDDHDRVMVALELHLSKRVPFSEEYRVVRKDGGVRYWIDKGVAFWDEKGNAYRMVGACSDITERRLAEQKLREAMAELERSNAELEQFAYVASHDLQEPLRMISSYTQLLQKRYKDRLDADANDFIRFAADGAKRMQELISDLLVYSRVGARRKPFAPTDSKAALEAAIANLTVSIQAKGAQITYDTLPVVMADEVQLVQLFQNLIDNSIKFCGEEPPRVHVSAQMEAGEWVFSIRDNGIGIDPRYFERVFVVFQRLHGGQYSGTGIGLATAKKIVQNHGGRIWLESQPGKGTTVYFKIPTKGGEGA